MSSKYAVGKKALGVCDRCGFEYKLKQLKELIVNENKTNVLVCPDCWETDHPQNKLGKYLVVDAEGLRNPRPDTTYNESRDTQWGWRPVGFNNPLGLTGLNNDLEASGGVGSVTITTS